MERLNDKNEIHALITKNSEWSHKIDKIYQACISVAYDQTHDHQCLTSIVSQALKSKQSSKNHQIKQERKKQHSLSLEAYDLYIFLPLWQQVTKKFLENA